MSIDTFWGSVIMNSEKYSGIVLFIGDFMRIILCDTNPAFTDQLEKYIKEFFSIHQLDCPEIKIYDNGNSLLNDVSSKDIIILDALLHELNGITISNQLRCSHPNMIVFVVTLSYEFLDDAMRSHVFCYLSKPLDKNRLFRNLQDALHTYSLFSTKIILETKTRTYIFNTFEIICVEAIGHKVIVHTTKGDYEVLHSMSYWIQLLPSNCFFQSHRSFIVNFAHVTDFTHTLIHLDSQTFSAYLTRRKYKAFKSAYLTYLKSIQSFSNL